MTERLPLFPLGAVLFPGLVLPLHVFEERYRMLVGHLLDLPPDRPRRFGVVAIELGHEVGADAARRLAGVGCTAEIHGVTRYEDGRFDIVATGGTRFRIDEIDDSLPYLRAGVTMLPDEVGPVEDPVTEAVIRLFHRYCARMRAVGAALRTPGELPTDPVALSYRIAASVVLDRPDKQRLLEAEHAAARLNLERELLHREIRILTTLPTVPVAELLQKGVDPN